MIHEITDVSKIEALFGDWMLPVFLNYAKDPGMKFFVTDTDAPPVLRAYQPSAPPVKSEL